MPVADVIKIPKAWTKRSWTFQEMEAELPEPKLPVRLWDGKMVMSPAPFASHQKVVFRFSRLRDELVTLAKLAEVFTAPLFMVLTPRQVVQPDVLFISVE